VSQLFLLLTKVPMALGILWDAVLGPSSTRIYQGNDEERTEQIQSTFAGCVDVRIISREIIYHTTFKRWWIPDSKDTVYEVCGWAPDEYKDQVSPLFFQPVTFPLLRSRFLRSTSYPHLYAINAYCDRVLGKATYTKVM
jgi:hypothetical protein